MAVHLLHLILITITTMITNYSCGKLDLKMPLTINPVVQDAIIRRGELLKYFYNSDLEYYSRLSPAHMVVKLNNTLSFVMRKSIEGAVVLGVAAKAAGLTIEQLEYIDSLSKWSVNITQSEIRGVLKEEEEHLLPLSDNITITELQNLGLRALQKRYNVSLHNSTITNPLHSSKAATLTAILQDWIRVVRFITKTNVDRLAASHKVAVSTLAQSLKLTKSELYHMTLNQLDGVLSTKFTFVDGSLEVLVSTVKISTEQSTLGTPVQTSTERKSPTKSNPTRKMSTIPQVTEKKSFSTKSLDLQTTVSRPSKDNSVGEMGTTNMAVYIGVPAGLLLLLVASSTWCFRRKRRQSGHNSQEKKKTKNNNDIKMNKFWIEKNDSELSPNQDEPRQDEHIFRVRSPPGRTSGIDSSCKGPKYIRTSSTFAINGPLKITNSIYDLESDTRQEIFV